MFRGKKIQIIGQGCSFRRLMLLLFAVAVARSPTVVAGDSFIYIYIYIYIYMKKINLLKSIFNSRIIIHYR